MSYFSVLQFSFFKLAVLDAKYRSAHDTYGLKKKIPNILSRTVIVCCFNFLRITDGQWT